MKDNALVIFDSGVFSNPWGFNKQEGPTFTWIVDAIVGGIVSRYVLKKGWLPGLIVGGLAGAAFNWKSNENLKAYAAAGGH